MVHASLRSSTIRIVGKDSVSHLLSISPVRQHRQTPGCCHIVQAARPPMPRVPSTICPDPSPHQKSVSPLPLQSHTPRTHNPNCCPPGVGVGVECVGQITDWSASFQGRMNGKNPPDHTVNKIWVLNVSEPCDWSTVATCACVGALNSQLDTTEMLLFFIFLKRLCNFATDKCTAAVTRFPFDVKWHERIIGGTLLPIWI